MIKEQPCGVPPNAKRPQSESASPEPKRSRVDGGAAPKLKPLPVPEPQKIPASPGIPTLMKPSSSEIPYEPERKDIVRPIVERKRTASETLRREKEMEEIIARRRQLDDEEKETENETTEQDPPYEGPICGGCLRNYEEERRAR